MALATIGSSLKGKARSFLPLLSDLRISEQRYRLAPVRTLSTAQATSAIVGDDARTSAVVVAPSSPSTSTAPQLSHVSPPHVVETNAEAVALLRSQPIHYVVASLVGRTFLLHARDVFTLPRINDVQVGDVLELDRIHEVGSRDYTLRAQDPMSTRSRGAAALIRRSLPTSNVPERVDDGTIEELKESNSWAARLRPGGLAHIGAVLNKETVRVRCTVVEHTKGPMEVIVKKKRRKGYKRTIRHKQTYTRLRVEAIQLGLDSHKG